MAALFSSQACTVVDPMELMVLMVVEMRENMDVVVVVVVVVVVEEPGTLVESLPVEASRGSRGGRRLYWMARFKMPTRSSTLLDLNGVRFRIVRLYFFYLCNFSRMASFVRGSVLSIIIIIEHLEAVFIQAMFQ